jgi:hypothetical protein
MSQKGIRPMGELEPAKFGDKINGVKRRCSCGGDVRIQPNPAGGRIATCQTCGATLTFGG